MESFTRAVRDRVGRFELAGGGTLFLDEVGEIPLDMQETARVIQERTFERVGEERSRTADVRILAATNRNLKAEVEAGRFRQDLYYRLSVFPIVVPPAGSGSTTSLSWLRVRMRLSCRRLGISERPLTSAHLSELQGYSWPGNIRELQNVIERAAIASRTGLLRSKFPWRLLRGRRGRPGRRGARVEPTPS